VRYRLQDMTWEEVRDVVAPGTVAVLPLGSIEQHGPHLSVEVDSRLAMAVAERAVERAGRRIDAVLAPCLRYGASHHHLAFPGTMSISLPTYVQVLVDLAGSLVAGGFRHIFFLNGHGGNADPMRMAIRMLRDRHDAVLVAGASYWDLARDEIAARRCSGPGGMSHGCELETSMMMHVRAAAVKPDRIEEAMPSWCSPYLVEDLIAGGSGVSLGYHTQDVSATGTMGDPRAASPAAGEAFLDAVSDRVAAFLVDFSAWRMNALVRRE
jgi:creatinine amidohydrolase